MSKHIIILGHGEGQPGASGFYKSERSSIEDIGRAIKTQIARHSLSKDVEVIDKINVYARNDFAKNTSKYRKAKSVTEIHLNAVNGKVRGTEILFGAGLKEDAIDKRLRKMLSKYWTWRRYLKSDSYQNPRVAKRLGINYRLIEYCFCDNKKDIDVFNQNLETLAKETLECLLGRALQYPVNATKPTDVLYRVQVGAYAMKTNAERQLKKVRKHFPDAFISTRSGIHRIQVGAYSNRSNAEKQLVQALRYYKDAFITI